MNAARLGSEQEDLSDSTGSSQPEKGLKRQRRRRTPPAPLVPSNTAGPSFEAKVRAIHLLLQILEEEDAAASNCRCCEH
jgi:hypothetical protein